MACDCNTEIEKLKCKIKALEENQDLIWDSVYNDSDPFVLYFAGDIGKTYLNSHVDKLSTYLNNELSLLGPRFLGFFAAGDLNYPSGSAADIDNRLTPWSYLINNEVFFPVLGNHDLASGEEYSYMSRFTYLPANGPIGYSAKRAYYVDFRDKIGTVVYAFDPYYKTSTVAAGVATLIPSVNSIPIAAQQSWFYDNVTNLAEGTRFNIPVIHHPFATVEDGVIINDGYMPSWDLDFAQNRIPFVVNGHSHLSSHVIRKKTTNPFNETHILNASTFGGSRPYSNLKFQALAGYSHTVPFASSEYHCVKMEFYKTKVIVSFIAVESTLLLDGNPQSQHSFIV